MTGMDRRQFLRIAGVSALTVPLAGALDACSSKKSGKSTGTTSGSASAAASSPGGGGKVGKLKLALSSSTLPTYLPQIAGPLLYGKDFGLDITRDDIVVFQSHATAVQAALSGKVNAVGASTMANLSVIAQGSPFKIFQPYSLSDDYVIAGLGDIKTLQDIKSQNAVLGIDSQGGAARTAMDAILVAQNAGFLVGDLKKTQDIESSGERASALAAGQVQVSVVHKSQADQAAAAGKQVNILASLYQSAPDYLKEVYAAPQKWLEANQATATALSASIIKASREMRANEDTFISAVKQLIKQPPSEAQLKNAWQLIQQYDFWPAQVTGLESKRVQFMLDLGVKEGILAEGRLTADSVIDMGPVNAALKQLGPATSGTASGSASAPASASSSS
jgi:ABC-type nitrate/sulfonate/bicarbonate transport system substrate-binding protein